MEEGGKERTKEEVFAVVGGNTKKGKKEKEKTRQKGQPLHTIIDYGKCITFSCKIFIPIKYYIKEEKRRVKNGATRV